MPYYNSSLANQYSNELGRATLPIIGLLNNYNNKDNNNQEYDENSNKIYGGSVNTNSHSKFDRFKDLGIPAIIIYQTDNENADHKLQHIFTPFLISNAHVVGVNELKGNDTMRISNAQRCKSYSSNEDSHLLNEDKFEKMFKFMLHGQSDQIKPSKIKKSVTKSNRRPNKKSTKKTK